MNPLLDSLASGFAGDATRRELLEAVLRDGLPGPRSESWKYTSLRALERRSFAAATQAAAIDPALLAHVPAPRLVFVNGCHEPALSLAEGLPAGVELLASGRETAYEDAPPADAVFAAAFGAQQPVSSNEDEAGRARNRRVEIAPMPRPRQDGVQADGR